MSDETRPAPDESTSDGDRATNANAPNSEDTPSAGWLARPRPLWLNALLLLAAAGFGWVLCMRALILSDEGYLLLQAWDLLDGRVLYRDMDSFVAPGVWFLLAGAFAAFGPSVFVSRIVIFACWLALVVCTERMTTRHISPAAGLLAAVSMVLFSVWAFPAWTFSFYSPYSVCFALLGLERLLAWWHGGSHRTLLVCGLWLGLSIVFKQNYGVFALLGAMLGFALMCLERAREQRFDTREALVAAAWTAGGVFAAGLPVLVYLLANGAFADAWQSLVVHPFEFAGAHDIPVAPLSLVFEPDIYSDAIDRLTYLSFPQLNTSPIALLQPFRATHRLHVLLYWFPLAIFVGGALLAVHWRERRIDPVLGSVVCVCGAVYLGLFPRADFNHLVNVYQPVVVAGVFVASEAHRRLADHAQRAARVFAIGVGLVAVVYGTVALIWWNDLRTRLVAEVPGDRGGVKISIREAETLGYMMRAIESHTRRGEPLLTVPDFAMLNFLTDRPMPSAYYNLYEHHISFDDGLSVVEGSERSGVRVALTRYNNFFSDRRGLEDYAPVLADYLETHFRRSVLGGSDDYVLLEKRHRPVDKVAFTNGLEACDVADAPPGEIEVRRHLLFSALYHKAPRGRGMPAEGRTTRCAIDVPASGARVAFEIGYRRPLRTTPNAKLEAVVFVADQAGEIEVARERFRVAAGDGQGPQLPYRRVEIDLAPWAGQRIELVFHTVLDGSVRVHPLDFKGFAQVYRDVRVIADESGITR